LHDTHEEGNTLFSGVLYVVVQHTSRISNIECLHVLVVM